MSGLLRTSSMSPAYYASSRILWEVFKPELAPYPTLVSKSQPRSTKMKYDDVN